MVCFSCGLFSRILKSGIQHVVQMAAWGRFYWLSSAKCGVDMGTFYSIYSWKNLGGGCIVYVVLCTVNVTHSVKVENFCN